ncbi:hypothetical protein M2341_001167 [Sphingobium sp. B7D2B]|uniref:hypothetical protein n=1 Tax=Sphingobium sp. B7D2B TaxID=2940583 RepID=UPI0022247AD7|nr:hypothetical protein [Sphingobium sp. B7D2B]MCW2365720.1 hypothetical protein [Sphingobium sp. B7D2B]
MTALFRAMAGLIAWAAAFALLYAVQGLACAWGWDDAGLASVSAARVVLVVIYLVSVGAAAWLCWVFRPQPVRPESSRMDLLAWLAFASAVTGLVSILYTGIPVLTATICT